MKIKTIVHDVPEAFDNLVNAAVADGYSLIRRDVCQVGPRAYKLYAELFKYDPIPGYDVEDDSQEEICLPKNSKSMFSKEEFVNAPCGRCSEEMAAGKELPDTAEEEVTFGNVALAMKFIKWCCDHHEYCPDCPIYPYCKSELPFNWDLSKL